jgi:DNA-binding protein H-NS
MLKILLTVSLITSTTLAQADSHSEMATSQTKIELASFLQRYNDANLTTQTQNTILQKRTSQKEKWVKPNEGRTWSGSGGAKFISTKKKDTGKESLLEEIENHTYPMHK